MTTQAMTSPSLAFREFKKALEAGDSLEAFRMLFSLEGREFEEADELHSQYIRASGRLEQYWKEVEEA